MNYEIKRRTYPDEFHQYEENSNGMESGRDDNNEELSYESDSSCDEKYIRYPHILLEKPQAAPKNNSNRNNNNNNNNNNKNAEKREVMSATPSKLMIEENSKISSKNNSRNDSSNSNNRMNTSVPSSLQFYPGQAVWAPDGNTQRPNIATITTGEFVLFNKNNENSKPLIEIQWDGRKGTLFVDPATLRPIIPIYDHFSSLPSQRRSARERKKTKWFDPAKEKSKQNRMDIPHPPPAPAAAAAARPRPRPRPRPIVHDLILDFKRNKHPLSPHSSSTSSTNDHYYYHQSPSPSNSSQSTVKYETPQSFIPKESVFIWGPTNDNDDKVEENFEIEGTRHHSASFAPLKMSYFQPSPNSSNSNSSSNKKKSWASMERHFV